MYSPRGRAHSVIIPKAPETLQSSLDCKSREHDDLFPNKTFPTYMQASRASCGKAKYCRDRTTNIYLRAMLIWLKALLTLRWCREQGTLKSF